MLPSTGYFKEISCPFYESGLCERPYCHFRHVKREPPDNPRRAKMKGAGEILHRIGAQTVKNVLQQETETSVGGESSDVSNSSEATPKSPEKSAADEPVATAIGDTNPLDSIKCPTEQTKVPSYKPTPIAVLKKRHIPIPYSPSLAKSSSIILKRRSSDGTPVMRKKHKLMQEYEPDSSGEKLSGVQCIDSEVSSSLKCEQSDKLKSSAESSVRYVVPDSSLVTSSSYKPTYIGSTSTSLTPCSVSSSEGSGIGNDKHVVPSKEYERSNRDLKKSDKCSKYSPVPVAGSSQNIHYYIPSNIQSLQQQQNSYEPVGKTSELQSTVSYKPSDITVSSSEPTYVPCGTNGSIVNNITYKPSSISNAEPEYQPLSTDNLVKEYVPTEISKLDSMGSDVGTDNDPVSNGLDSLHDITNDNLKVSSSVDKYGMLNVKRDFKEGNREMIVSSDYGKNKVIGKSDICKKHIKGEKKHHRDDRKHFESKRHSSSKRDNGEKSHHSVVKEKSSHKSDQSSKKNDTRNTSCKDDDKKRSSGDRKHSSQKQSHISSSEHSKHQSTKNVEKVKQHPKSAKDKSHNVRDKSKCQGDSKKKQDSSGKQKPSYTTSSKHEVNKGKSSEGGLFKKPTRGSKSSVHHSRHTNHPATVKTSHKKQVVEENSSSDDSPERTCGSVNEGTTSDIHCNDDSVTLPSDAEVSSPEDCVTKQCRKIFAEEYSSKTSKSVLSAGTKRTMAEKPQKGRSAQLPEKDEASSVPFSSQMGYPNATSTQSMTSPPSGRIRIAYVPNVTSILNAKLRVQEQLKERQEQYNKPPHSSSTVSSSAASFAQSRVAHVPPVGYRGEPVMSGTGAKLPVNVRQSYLNLLAEEYIKIYPDGDQAFKQAIEAEKSIYDRCSTKHIYLSSVTNLITRLRRENASQGMLSYPSTSKASTSTSACGPPTLTPVPNKTISHGTVLAGKGATKGSWSIEKPKRTQAPSARSFYELFGGYVLTDEELKSNGYPHEHPEEKGVAVIHKYYRQPPVVVNEFERTCCRCSRRYFIDKHGLQIKEESCIYHWGKTFQTRVLRTLESRYSCCGTPPDSDGCSLAPCHVSDGYDPNALRGFVRTVPGVELPADGNFGIFAIDCEMSYTVAGLELTRVTVVGINLAVVYETLVKPSNAIIDYNTRFSGIKEGDLDGVTTTLRDVQRYLLNLFSDKTILVGHSLESDLKALKLIHMTVVDTSVVFPHKMGPPKKRALKNLVREYLHKIIQCGDEGHDSAEDARACMELMLYKIKQSS